jgi:hypothetical protein
MARPLQVYVDDTELKRLEVWSRARGWTKSQAVRAAIRALTRSGERVDPLLLASGMIEGLPPDCSERFDRYLEETFVAEERAPYGARRRRSPTPVRR